MCKEQHPFVSGRWYQNNNVEQLDIADNWFIKRDEQYKVQCFSYMPSTNVKSIFLGSFPIWELVTGDKDNNRVEFFYGSLVNDFWSCLGEVSNKVSISLMIELKY